MAITKHLHIEESIAVEALFFDPQLSIDATQTVKFGAVGADMCFIDEIITDRAGKDLD